MLEGTTPQSGYLRDRMPFASIFLDIHAGSETYHMVLNESVDVLPFTGQKRTPLLGLPAELQMVVEQEDISNDGLSGRFWLRSMNVTPMEPSKRTALVESLRRQGWEFLDVPIPAPVHTSNGPVNTK